MTITFFTNYVHHHQIPLADAFYQELGNDYKFVALEKLPDWLIKGGYDPTIERSYIIRAYESDERLQEAKTLMIESDIVIGTSGPMPEVFYRQEQNKLTFHYAERWLKGSILMALDPRRVYDMYKKYTRFRNKKSYLLCASAFASSDADFYHCFPNKKYKWGYFPQVESNIGVQRSYSRGSSTFKLMWCSRFIDWKHPEMPIKLAHKLKQCGYNFVIDMYGSGVMYEDMKKLVCDLSVVEQVNFCGNKANTEILLEMQKHDIFLFTSDKGEGWGAVLNEAMSCGCAVVASNQIGAAPYLIKDKENGLLFESGNIDSLKDKVIELLNNDSLIPKYGKRAQATMSQLWSPQIAANRFLKLASGLLSGINISFEEGPCSKA